MAKESMKARERKRAKIVAKYASLMKFTIKNQTRNLLESLQKIV